ncbi:MAG: WhiB family transcriptional regulator [Actinobacteria bacterium]|nr:WhiB family transcriptional regulator [Actinomycetota bacterium]
MVGIERAKAICAGCGLRRACFEGAQGRREPAGVWGGRLFVGAHVGAFNRKRGRPAKAAGGAAMPAAVCPDPVKTERALSSRL